MSTGPSQSAAGTVDQSTEANAERADQRTRERDLDALVQLIFAAGISLHEAAALSDQPEVVRRLEQISGCLDAIVRQVWQASIKTQKGDQ